MKTRGFTLIELLVVIAIIGLLSSIVLASLNSARAKARDAAVKQEVNELRTIMALNYNDYGSYANLQTTAAGVNWVPVGATCATYPVSGTYALKVQQICTAIVNSQGGTGANSQEFYLGNGIDNTKNYSILVWLPGAQTYWCAGSSGAASTDPGTWNNAGCYYNP